MWKIFSPPKIFKKSKKNSPGSNSSNSSLNSSPSITDTAAQRDVITAQREAERLEFETAIALSLSAQDTATAPPGIVYEEAPSSVLGAGLETSGLAPSTNDGDSDPGHAAQARAIEKLTEIVVNCDVTREQFVDPEFRPVPQSLYANGQSRRRDAQRMAVVQHYGTSNLERVEWRQAGQILQRPDDLQMKFDSQQEMLATLHQFSRVVAWKVFQNDPCASDISQGGLGNCWFCGSLAAVAEKPDVIRRLFVDSHSSTGELSPVGVYAIRLCDGGEWKFQIIDGLLPCNKCNMLAFSGARRNQLWVPLLEKAYAKLRGHYEAIEGGTPAEGLRLFTGWPSIVQELQRLPTQEALLDSQLALKTQSLCPFAGEDYLWTRLESAFASRLIMCGSCGHVDGITDEQYRSVGLSPSHCYSIIQVGTALNGSLRLVRLRNPWGTGRKWTGRFSDRDTENWTEEIKQEVGAQDLGAEGIFWMTIEDVRKYFTSITICPYREGWAEARRMAVFPAAATWGSQPAFILESDEPVEALISLMQPEERACLTMMTADFGLAIFRLPRGKVPPAGQSFETPPAGMMERSMSDCVKRRVQDTLVCDCFLSGDGRATPPAHLVVPLSFNQRSMAPGAGCSKPFIFACFSPKPVLLRSVRISAEAHRDALVAHVKRAGIQTRLFHNVNVYRVSDAGLAVYVENSSHEALLFESRLTDIFNLTVSRGMEANAQGEQYLNSRDSIPPKHGMIIFVAAAMPSGHNYCFNSKCGMLPRSIDNVHEPPLAEPCDALHTPFFLC